METEITTRVRNILKEFTKDYSENCLELLQESEKVTDACRMIARSWSGSFAGWHGTMYYRNFEIPPLGQKFSGVWGATYR
jgi:hypothetical protein